MLFLPVFSVSCSQEESLTDVEQDLEIPDWTELTHGSDTEPDFEMVFPENNVLRIDIQIDPDSWEEMQTDLTGKLSGGNRDLTADPVWVPCSVWFNSIQWYKVGIRFKGNSSLKNSYREGIKKLPFKLDFDQFEDTWPAIKNQRFYGFKQLSLKNNYLDKSFIREKVASDLFLDFGLISPHTAFYQLYIDFGEGTQYFGLYTLVEEVDDTVIKTQYSESGGNLYKPEGNGASFAEGSFRTSDMYKKSNETENDYSDVENLYEIINSNKRETDIEYWKSQLSEVFDVPVFLKWLAANTCMQNWDTYGVMTHNYYLYNNPETEKLEWIPWDNNEALQYGKQGGALSVTLDEVETNWPFIRYIIDNTEWKEQYKQELYSFTENIFEPERMSATYEKYRSILGSYVIGDAGEENEYTFLNSDSEFDAAIDFLNNHVSNRNSVVQEYLEE